MNLNCPHCAGDVLIEDPWSILNQDPPSLICPECEETIYLQFDESDEGGIFFLTVEE